MERAVTDGTDGTAGLGALNGGGDLMPESGEAPSPRLGDDPGTLAILRDEVLPALCRSRPPRTPVRMWVVDCATSDLPWLLAALVVDRLDAQGEAASARIFVTDADEARINEARRRSLPESIARVVPPDRVDRYFVREGAGYRPRKALRDVCLFARHDPGADPSFRQLDLIVWDDAARGRGATEPILAAFHRVLCPGGSLVLGSTSGVAEALRTGWFTAVSERHGVLRPCEAKRRAPLDPAAAELAVTRRHLEAAIHDLDRAHERFRRDDELQTANEELQTANEELRVAREEQQAISEELTTLNEELARKIAELDRANADLRNSVTFSPAALVFLDHDARIRSYTPPAEALFRLIPADLGRPVADIAALARDGDLGALARGVLDTGAPLRHEVHLAEGDRWFVRSLRPYEGTDGEIEGVVVAYVEVTEQKRAEVVLQEADRHKDELLALLAHELRNPLAPIRNVTFLLQRPSEGTLARVRGIIERQVGHMARLIDDLLDVSRIRQGKMALEQRSFELGEVVRAAVDDQRPAFEARHVSLEPWLSRDPLRMVGDAARINQVVGNLLHNALKFTPPGGRVRVALSTGPEPGMASLVIEDTGVGIGPDHLPRIFDAFVQGDEGCGGLGLGLSLVQGLAVLHGGSARAESRGPGCGARFTVTLPVNASASSSPEGQPAAGSAVRVMVVEDNEDAAESMRLLVELLGHAVSVERSGDAAVARARTFRPNVVLCDINLPGDMSGYDVARALRADPDLSAARLVAVTGYGSESDRRRAAEAGFEVHLTKPVHPEKLERVVTRLAEE